MTKDELITAIATQRAMPRKAAAQCVEALFTALRETLQVGSRIDLRGFGTFTLRARSARQGRNLRTGEAISIPEHKTVHFKPAPGLKAGLTARH